MRRRLLILLVGGALLVCAQKRERARDEESKREGAAALAGSFDSIQRKVRLASGEEVDLTATLRRIAEGQSLHDSGLPAHDGDGTVFLNLTDREAGRRPLPSAERGYYIEYVHPPPRSMRWPGPRRVIVGRRGEVYFSPDHYRADSIIPLHRKMR
jgi:guanyl-specific ribonuclease Sa